MNLRNYVILGVAVLVGMAAILVGGIYFRPYSYQGSLIDPPMPAADIRLTDQSGKPFELNSLHGKVVLMFFGYTNCQDVCPATLANLKQIRAKLGSQAANVQVLFVTVDPERDSPQRLQQYLAGFDPSFMGLTGRRDELEPVWNDFGIYVAKDTTASDLDYIIDHSGLIYAIDRKGMLRLTYTFDAGNDLIYQDIAHLVREN
jgi:protein SCO1/2